MQNVGNVTFHQSCAVGSPQDVQRVYELSCCFLGPRNSAEVARSFTFGHNFWPHHLPIWSLPTFLSCKAHQKEHNYFGR